MEYTIKPLDSRDRKNIYLLLLLFSSPGIIILLTYLYVAISWNSREIFITSLPIVLGSIIIPHIFSIRYILILNKNKKYVIEGILTSILCNNSTKNRTCSYIIDGRDKFTTTSIADTFCDQVYKGNMVELHILPFMYAKKKVFYVTRKK